MKICLLVSDLSWLRTHPPPTFNAAKIFFSGNRLVFITSKKTFNIYGKTFTVYKEKKKLSRTSLRQQVVAVGAFMSQGTAEGGWERDPRKQKWGREGRQTGTQRGERRGEERNNFPSLHLFPSPLLGGFSSSPPHHPPPPLHVTPICLFFIPFCAITARFYLQW